MSCTPVSSLSVAHLKTSYMLHHMQKQQKGNNLTGVHSAIHKDDYLLIEPPAEHNQDFSACILFVCDKNLDSIQCSAISTTLWRRAYKYQLAIRTES